MINLEVTIALVIIEILLLAGFLGVIIAISRFSRQIKETAEDLFESVTGNIKELRKELQSYKEELDAIQKKNQEKKEDSFNII
jgi:Skp family chaperone for outer membrane proteins